MSSAAVTPPPGSLRTCAVLGRAWGTEEVEVALRTSLCIHGALTSEEHAPVSRSESLLSLDPGKQLS